MNACRHCHQPQARLYELYSFSGAGLPVEPQRFWLCVRCARQQRQTRQKTEVAGSSPEIPSAPHISRAELIARLDRFWEESGAGEICRRCHEQGTGCCPPMCRYLSAAGCQKKNVFCTGFVCSALLNAISECDPDTGRLLKWIKNTAGAAEFRLYEMVTRVPGVDREQARPLLLPSRYPAPAGLEGISIRKKLSALQSEILQIRRNRSLEERRDLTSAAKPRGLPKKSGLIL